jgi:Outer membrane protein beta-barrel domain
MLGHDDEAAARALLVGREQRQHQPIGGVAVELPEAVDGVPFVKFEVTHVVPTGGFTRGAAAGEDGFFLPFARFHHIVFEELDGQVGDLRQRCNCLTVNAQQREVTPVQGVVRRLETEDFQGQRLEIPAIEGFDFLVDGRSLFVVGHWLLKLLTAKIRELGCSLRSKISPKIKFSMKKTMISASLLFLAFGLFAQLTIAPNIGMSMSTSKFSFGNSDNEDYAPRLFAGVQAGYGFSEKFGLGLGFQYAGKGYKYRDISSTPLEFKYEYYEAIAFAEYKPFHFMGVVLGPSVGFLKDITFVQNGTPINANFNFIDDKEFGVMAGLKFYWKDVFLNLTFNRSILPIAEYNLTDENGAPAGIGKEFNQSFRLGVGYNFHLKKK